MHAHDLVDQLLDVAKRAHDVHWVVNAPEHISVDLHRDGALRHSAAVRLRCDDIRTLVDIGASHRRCCLPRHSLQERIAAIEATTTTAAAAAGKYPGASQSIAELFTGTYRRQQASLKLPSKKKAVQRLVYVNRPVPFVRHAADGGVHYCVCLEPALELRLAMASSGLDASTPSGGPSPSLPRGAQRAAIKQLVPLFLGICVDATTQPFITSESTHDILAAPAASSSDEAAHVGLLPLQALVPQPDGTTLARYACVEYCLTTTPAPARQDSPGVEMKRPRTETTHRCPVSAIPLAFDFFVPTPSDRGNGWTDMGRAMERLESYKPQTRLQTRYGLNPHMPPLSPPSATNQDQRQVQQLRRTARASVATERGVWRVSGRHERAAVRKRPAQLLEAFLSVGRHDKGCAVCAETEVSPSPCPTPQAAASPQMCIAGGDPARRLTVADHPTASLHWVGTLRSSVAIPVETCVMPNSIVLSSVLPCTALGKPASAVVTTSLDVLTPVHTLGDAAAALQKGANDGQHPQ